MKVLGISCFYHDSAVCAIEDSRILFAIHEERLSRLKHDARFPVLAVAKALEFCRWKIEEIDEIVFYEEPQTKIERIMDQIVDGWPHTWKMFSSELPKFIRDKYPVGKIIKDLLRFDGAVSCCQHHRAHAAAAFYTSSYDDALVITVDGVGEYETVAVHEGVGNRLEKRCAIHFPDSLGLLYSVFTDYLGFEVNEGEYKVMGLASYGQPKYYDVLVKNIISFQDDGSFRLNLRYFDFNNSRCHYSGRLVSLLLIEPRRPQDPVGRAHEDLAASVQKLLEDSLTHMLSALLMKYPHKNVCLGGGVALNCTANASIVRRLGVGVHIHPAAGDAGGALGAALDRMVQLRNVRGIARYNFSSYLGNEYTDLYIENTLKINKIAYIKSGRIAEDIAQHLAEGRIVAVMQGRDEWGPRALGNRSILADPRLPGMKGHLNAKIKFREEFCPFAPMILEEYYGDYFETLGMQESPHMLFTHKALKAELVAAAVHVDQTSRVQTVSCKQNPFLYAVLEEFYRLTGVPVLINTSFNLRGEPIVSSPSDALKTFYASGINVLALGEYFVVKDTA